MISNQNSSRFDWADCAHLLRARWTAVVLIASIVFAGGAAILWKFPQKYRATVTIQVLESEPGIVSRRHSSDVQASSMNRLGREMTELQSRELLADVVRKTHLVNRWRMASPLALSKLREQLTVRRALEDNTLIVEVLDISTDGAAELANAIADRFVSRATSSAIVDVNQRSARLSSEVANQREEVAKLEQRLLDLNGGPAAGTETVGEVRRKLLTANNLLHALEARHQAAVIEASEEQNVAAVMVPADPSTAVALGSAWMTASCLVVLGLSLGVCVVSCFSIKKGRLEVIGRLGGNLKIKVSGLTPVTGKSLMDRARPGAALIEPFRDLRTKVDRLPAGDCLFLSLVPDGPAEGFAEVLVNLAAVHADAGNTMLVIDADMRAPRLHRCFDAAQHPGLSDYLSGEMRLEETVLKTRRDNLWFMPSGPMHDDPGGLISGRRMTDLVWEMRSRFDYIFVSAPAVLEFAEAGALTEITDHTIAVTSYRSHSLAQLQKVKATVELASGIFSGVILTEPLPVDDSLEPTVQIRPTKSGRKPANALGLEAVRSKLVSRIRLSRQADQ